ncbi:hypothetical protein RYX36_030138, partial [Vicia faba]
FKNNYDFHYRTLKNNMDMLKLIQLGLTFSYEHMNLSTFGDVDDGDRLFSRMIR